MADCVGEWRSFFSEHNIFDVIENAIMLAATDFPSEFKENREIITEMLFTGINPKSTGNFEKKGLIESKVAETPKQIVMGMKSDMSNQICSTYGEVTEALMSNEDESTCAAEDFELINDILKVKAILDNGEEQTNDMILDSLRKLQAMDMTFKALYDTKIGFSVANCRRHESSDIKTLAKRLYRDWRNFVVEWEANHAEIVAEYVKTKKALEEEKSCTFKKNEITLLPIKKTVRPPTSNLIQCNNEDTSIRNKLEIAKRKLHEQYEECEKAKRQRTIKVLELKDLPKQTTEHSRKLNNCGRNQTNGKKQGYCFQHKCF